MRVPMPRRGERWQTEAPNRNPFLMAGKRIQMSKQAIDQDLIRQLAALLKETELSEIEIEQDNLRVRVARTLVGAAAQIVAAPVSAPSTDSKSEQEKPVDPAKHPGTVPSPMVGTAYYSPAPGAKPFVTVGDAVSAGQTVMIVEAMKTMNQNAAPRGGRVTAILVADGAPVEYGEPLLVIE
jgi:acetyl-CoA carboxylase biotin carboxyl carrier protein